MRSLQVVDHSVVLHVQMLFLLQKMCVMYRMDGPEKPLWLQ